MVPVLLAALAAWRRRPAALPIADARGLPRCRRAVVLYRVPLLLETLAGVLLAAGRNGLVAPLTYETRWKIPFNAAEITGTPPAGLPASEATPRSGRIAFDDREYGFCLTGNPKGSDLRVNIDLNGDGAYSGPFRWAFP